MGIWAWLLLFVIAAGLATAAQYTFLRDNRSPGDSDWVFIAGGALLGGFTGSVWYAGFGPVIDGLSIVPALAGAIIVGAIAELVYRRFIRPRQAA